MSEAGLYPRVRSAVRVVPDAPVHSVTLGQNDLQFKGVPNALLVDVISRFTGRHTLESICEIYPKNVAPVVKLIASKMQERRMLLSSRRSRDSWDEKAPPGAESTWAYISDRLPDPIDAFRRWRAEPIFVTGHGRSFRQAVTGLITAGAGQLRIGASLSADEEELQARLESHAASDREFGYAWVGAEGEAEGGALLLHVVDGDVLDGSTQGNIRARSHRGRRILGGVVDGWGIVLRAPAGGPAERPLLPPPAAGPGGIVSDYALAVVGSMAAFQALNSVVMDPEATPPVLIPATERILIRPDGGLYVSEPAGSPAPEPEPEQHHAGASQATHDGARSPHQRERERWIGSTSAFFSGAAPLLAWEDEIPLPAFPLAHRALRVLPGHGEREHLLVEWAVLPSEITALTLKSGVAALADALTERSGHAVGLAMDDWSTAAYLAWAEAGAPAELLGSSDRRLRYEDSDDVRFRTLVRLINLYLGELPTIAISLDDRSQAPRADVAAGGSRRFALGASPLEAAIEALGRTLSGVQMGEPARLESANPPSPITTCGLGLREAAAFQPEGLGLEPRLLDSLGGYRVADFIVGRYARAGGDD